MYLLMLLVVVGTAITEAATEVKCPPGTVKIRGGGCEIISRRAAFSKDISDEPYCPKGKFYLNGDCVGRGKRAADVYDCPPGTVETDYGCIDTRRRAFDVSKSQDGSDEPYCPKGKFYRNGDCVGRGRRAARVTLCPPLKTDDEQCKVIGRRAFDVSKSQDGSDEPYCPTGTFYQGGLCVARPKRSPDDCPAGTVNMNGECVPDSGGTVDEPDCPVNLKKEDGGCGPN